MRTINPAKNITRNTKNARLEARVEPELLDLVTSAAAALHQSKSAFIASTLRKESEKVMARADVTLVDPVTWERMMSSLQTPDRAPRLREAMRGVPDLPVR